jgi:hypothetical protein
MAAIPEIDEFFERAKSNGANEQTLIGVLVARGWPEKEVYKALAAHYERLTGIEIPRRGGAGTAAKDAFFYLLIFSTLATWTFSLGWLAFTLIEIWLPDTLFSPYAQAYIMAYIASALASIFVSFPIFLLVSRAVLREGRRHPETLDSPVRKWLTYIVLVIAALVFMGDLITALTYLLRGEITSRFLAKAFVVLLLSGGVFLYYFGGLKRSETPKFGGRVSRDAAMAWVSALAVIVMAVLGFWRIGTPQTQRALRADGKRSQDLYGLSGQINLYWNRNHKLPEHLDQLPGAVIADAVTRQPYEYHLKEGSKYELCATFFLDSHLNDVTRSPSRWSHSAGRHCFDLDATENMDSPYPYFSPLSD